MACVGRTFAITATTATTSRIDRNPNVVQFQFGHRTRAQVIRDTETIMPSRTCVLARLNQRPKCVIYCDAYGVALRCSIQQQVSFAKPCFD